MAKRKRVQKIVKVMITNRKLLTVMRKRILTVMKMRMIDIFYNIFIMRYQIPDCYHCDLLLKLKK